MFCIGSPVFGWCKGGISLLNNLLRIRHSAVKYIWPQPQSPVSQLVISESMTQCFMKDHIQKRHKPILTGSPIGCSDTGLTSGWPSRLAPAPSHDLTLCPSSLSPSALPRPYNRQRGTQECVCICESVFTTWLVFLSTILYVQYIVCLKCVHHEPHLIIWQFSSWDLALQGTSSLSPFCCQVLSSASSLPPPSHNLPTWSLILSLRSNTLHTHERTGPNAHNR